MRDSIYRQAAIDALCYECSGNCIPCDSFPCGEVEAIQKLPSAQPERKKGKWINDRGLYKCSCCNRLWTEWWAISKPIERMRKECPYCPMCGSYNGEEIDGLLN